MWLALTAIIWKPMSKKFRELKARRKAKRADDARRNQRGMENRRQNANAYYPQFPISLGAFPSPRGQARARNLQRQRRLQPSARLTVSKHDAGLLHPLLPDIVEYPIVVSVIFGTYNRISHLKRCVASIRRACDDIPYEIICCDGGSSDGSVAWMQDQDDVRHIPGRLNGAVEAFNTCARQARGQFVLNLNDDAELHPLAVKNGLRYFDNPRVGQVAFAFRVRSGPLEIQKVRGQAYANYGMTRTNIVRSVEKICGGFWSPAYYTYGGDNELSMWVWRLGYTVAEATDAHVLDLHANDELRARSHAREQGRSAKKFFGRWPAEACAIFRGRPPGVAPTELQVLRLLESGELPAARWPRLVKVDPGPGELPPRAAPQHERVLHIHLRTDEDPQESLVQALRSIAAKGHALVDWLEYQPRDREAVIRQAAEQLRPTLVFAQIQGPHLSTELMRAIRSGPRDPSMVVVLWCGDVGTTNGPWPGFQDGWSHAMAREVDAMLYTGTGQVQMQRARGMANAAYLQIGFELGRYHPPQAETGRQGIVFLGQNYGPQWNVIPNNDAQVRRDLVSAFQRTFPSFTAYGGGWKRSEHLHQTKVGALYRRSLLALSVSLTSELGRYTSDRMIRSMACGTPTLVKRFADMEGMGLRDRENVLVWDTVQDAVNIAREWTDPARREELLAIGRAGAKLMHEHHTWNVRMHELSAILKALRGQR